MSVVQADPARRILVYACRICQYDEIGENMCVYRNDLVTVTKWVVQLIGFVLLTDPVCREQAGVTIDLGHDPTLVRLAIFPIVPSTDVHLHIPAPF